VTAPRPHRAVSVRVRNDQPCCPRCGQHPLLSADVPHGWDNPGRPQTTGTIPVALCGYCDADDPKAGPLITYFHVHGQVDAANMTEFAALAQAWADSITIPPVDVSALDEEIRAWEQGEL
jgi:hypothetical protein